MGLYRRCCRGCVFTPRPRPLAHFLWLDETDLFNESIYGNHHRSLLDFAFGTRNGTTQSWGWSAIFWIVTRAFGPSIAVARMPTVLVNTAGVALLFALVYRLLPESSVNRFWPALFAAIFAAISVVQMNYSQQTYPYGATPFLALAVMLARFEVRAAAGVEWKATPRLFRAVTLYTAAISLSFCVHASAALISRRLDGRYRFRRPPGPTLADRARA